MNRIEPSVWVHLTERHPQGDALAARVAFPLLTGRLQCAIDSNNHRHLLIALEPSDDELSDSRSRGLSVIARHLVIQGQQTPARYLDIECQDQAGYPALDIIGGELSEALTQTDASPREIVQKTLARWRRFWSSLPNNLLSYEQLLGLFGELWFLAFWLYPIVGVTEAVRRWRGPFGARHDYEWEGKSIEVKATSSTRGRVHIIHGLDQLLPPENGHLWLYSLRLREEAGATNTLPSLVAICKSRFRSDSDALSRFEIGLAREGYSPTHEDEYKRIFLRIVEESVFAVKDDFPSITNKNFVVGVPPGIETVNYEINLNTFNHLRVATVPDQANSFI